MDSWQEWLNPLQSLVGEWWIVQVFMVVLVTLMANMLVKRALDQVAQRLQKTKNLWDDALISALQKPVTWMVWLVGFSAAIELSREVADSPLLTLIEPVRDVLVILILTWFFIRFIKESEKNFLEDNNKPRDATTIHAIAKLFKLSVMITAALVILQSLGYSVSGVLAFGGIGGVAVGFAAKDLLANFFGGLMIYLDRPFKVGDWIRSSDRDIEGTVEEIGWRLTRIRTFDKRPLYVPNSVFANISVENPSRMSHRRIKETMGIRYDDISVLTKIVANVKKMLQNHPEIDATQTLIVNFDQFAPSSLDFFIYTFTKTTDWIKYHDVKQDVLVKVADIVAAHGAEMAYPTSTLHVIPSDAARSSEQPASSA